jgi:ParB/RepB/Spo0J family partition protein
LKISIAQIVVSKDNPRQSFDEEGLRRLGESIKEHGQLQSIIVRSRGSGYELVVGERRLRACALLGLSEIEADVKNVDDVTAMELRLIENTQREDLSDAEKGDAVLGLWANYDKYETLQDVAKAIGSTIGTVKHWTEFSRKLSDGVKAVTRARKLTDFQVRYLPKYPKYVQDKLVSVIADRNLTGRQVIVFLKEYDKTPDANLGEIADVAQGTKTITIKTSELPKLVLQNIEEKKQLAKVQRIPKKPSRQITKEQVKKKLEKKTDFKFVRASVSHGQAGLLPQLKMEVKPTILPNPSTPDYTLCKCALCPLFATHCKGRCWT